MGHTATEKILAKHANVKEVFPGDVVTCDVDLIFAHSPWMIEPYWDEIGGVKRVFNGDRVAFGLGHHVCLPSDERYAQDLVESRAMAKKYGIRHVYDMGTGNGHIIMLEKGHVYPGGLFVGADSHSTIYGAVGGFGTALSYEVPEILLSGKAWFKVPPTMRVNLEGQTPKGVCARDVVQYLMDIVGAEGALWRSLDFSGSYTRQISVYQRMIFCLMAVEMGAVTGFVEPDDITREFIRDRAKFPFEVVVNDPDCEFEKIWDVDVSSLEPMIGFPPRPSNCAAVAEYEAKNIKVHQAYLGGCTGSSVEDFRMAAEVLRGKSIHPDTRLVVVPGTSEIAVEMRKEGLTALFEDLGAIITPPYCGPCQMVCFGHLGDGEVMIGTHPRNQPGRAGTATVDTYLASPYTVAASAVAGKIVDPRKYL
jgi:3-isopropylmalate/(R)-2-methylmalate dehydratase large subunit